MKKNFVGPIGHVLLLASYFFSTAIIAQKNTWTWIGGDAYHANSPVYEKVNGGPEVNPGAREGATTVVSNGKVYLFGGATAKVGMDPKFLEWNPPTCYRNDLWEYDPAVKALRFISGTIATVSWQDPQPRVGAALWVLGTKAYIFSDQVWDGQEYYFEKNDMWEYDLVTGAQKMLFKYYSGGYPGIIVPSSRSYANTWVSNDKLYLFGGSGNNDIWEYTPSTNTWLQVRSNSPAIYGTMGIAAAENTPGGRTQAGSVQAGTKVFLFGGQGKSDASDATGELNDAWELNLATNQWRWIGGSKTLNNAAVYGTLNQPSVNNRPGGRHSAGCWWIDNKLWIGLGNGYDAQFQKGNLNDLWSYDTSTLQWCWRKGSNTKYSAGYFGNINTGTAQTNPGSKTFFSYWTFNNRLMLWGGSELDDERYFVRLNDCWSFDAASNIWTWVGGNSQPQNDYYLAGIYGNKGVPSSVNFPGGREQAATWSVYGKFYLFGGWGTDTKGKTGWLNDLWEFDPPSKKWTWISGFDTCNGTANYGTKGVAKEENLPGPRGRAASWSNKG
ncbi:MAG TPA: kelch repeat-containing protein, partial [Phnomibacter sp.]|nr:kelch repeat-containing protein [Phnomibacter sp.]